MNIRDIERLMSVIFNRDEYLKQHPDVKEWLNGYEIQTIRTFEPMVRNYIAIQRNGEMAKILGKDKS